MPEPEQRLAHAARALQPPSVVHEALRPGREGERTALTIIAEIAEALAAWEANPVAASAALLDLGRDPTATAMVQATCPLAATALGDLAEAVKRASREHARLWEHVLDDPLEADLPAAARSTRRSMEDAERALAGLRVALASSAQRDAAPATCPARLPLLAWLELIELQAFIAQRAVRSPLQLYRLAQLTRVTATQRAERLLCTARSGTLVIGKAPDATITCSTSKDGRSASPTKGTNPMKRSALIQTCLLAAAAACASVLLPGCAAELLNVTSGEIGCPREEITVRDGRSGWASRSWTAECRGQTYYCSGSAGNVDCQPAMAERAAGDEDVHTSNDGTPVASASEEDARGCRYDTQCKGDRVCRAGGCVNPSASSATHAARTR